MLVTFIALEEVPPPPEVVPGPPEEVPAPVVAAATVVFSDVVIG